MYTVYFSYSQELASRCKKEIINAARDVSRDHKNVHENDLVTLLRNIGAEGSVLKSDLENIIDELGDSHNHSINVDTLFKIL